MRLTAGIICLLALASGFGARAQEQPPVLQVAQIDAIAAAEGKQVRVRGLVESTGKSAGSGMNFLNFPGGEFTAVVFGRSLKQFPDGEPADVFKGKLVEVTGKVAFYRGKPQIELRSPSQIVVLDPATGKPLPDPKEPLAEPDPIEQQDPKAEPVQEVKPDVPAKGKVNPKLYFDDP